MQDVMKISAKNSMPNEEMLQNLPIGVVLISYEGHILLANKEAEQLLTKDKNLIVGKKLQSLLSESKSVEVQQLRRVIKIVDYAIETERKVVTHYSPFLGSNQELQGTLLLLQSHEEFNDMVSDFTKLEYWRSAMQKIAHFPGKSFRIVNKSGSVDVASHDWEKWIGYTEDLTNHVEEQFKLVLEKRRTIKRVINPETIVDQSIVIITEPIFHNGKIAGCLQELKIKNSNQDVERKIALMTRLIRKLENNYVLDDVIGQSTDIQLVKEQAKLYIKTKKPILISGEKGTGKRILAKAIHNESEQRYEAFITFDCKHPSFSLNKMKNHLSNFKKGTVFIYNLSEHILTDEWWNIVNTYSDFQMILSSTNSRVFSEKKNHILLPPLRERVEDIPLLVTHFIELFNYKYSLNIEKVDEQLLVRWKQHEWQGNVAELEIVIGHVMNAISSNQTELTLQNVKVFERTNDKQVGATTLQSAVDAFEKDFIQQTLTQCKQNKTKTAKLLGISVRSLYYKMEKYKIDGGD